jgi:hypothetical protein
MLRRLQFLTLSLALILSASATVKPACAQMVRGTEARTNVDRLTSDVHWFSNLRDAEDSGRQKDKPILWMHMLGKIDGAT